MRLPTSLFSRIAPLAILVPLAACSTTGEPSMGPTFATFSPVRPPVSSELAGPCIAAAASKYVLSERNIRAVDEREVGAGLNEVSLKVDIRDALCTVSDKGKVRSVVDTMGKSADQAAAEEAAAAKKAAGGTAADAPVKKTRKKQAQQQG
ncbi:hypothetical protein AB4Y96_24810 [Phyllobacterium sp. TAF24]|uniref:hypothetical protein n=1 Tax=unclassified Phyllobacterium TaxID=2638441 RepID=UPI000880FF57|nr:hypothetical protein [Phyllobacterium sp. OV277]SDN89461.1 hypothetical protein SAMN05443582_101419 [Phyllobacterium sp. OV277]